MQHCGHFSTQGNWGVWIYQPGASANGAQRRTSLPRCHTEWGRPSNETLNQRQFSLSLAKNLEDRMLSQRGQVSLQRSSRFFMHSTGPRTQVQCTERLRLHRCVSTLTLTAGTLSYGPTDNTETQERKTSPRNWRSNLLLSIPFLLQVPECEHGFWTTKKAAAVHIFKW